MSRTTPASGRRGLSFIGSFEAYLLAIELGKNAWQATTFDASNALFTNFQRALATGFPKDLPLLLFVAAENKQTLVAC